MPTKITSTIGASGQEDMVPVLCYVILEVKDIIKLEYFMWKRGPECGMGGA